MEKQILKETVSSDKPVSTKPRQYKPRNKKKYNLSDEFVSRSQEIPNISGIKKQVGYYKIGKSFHIFFEEKPKSIHRYFTKLFLGWKWHDQK